MTNEELAELKRLIEEQAKEYTQSPSQNIIEDGVYRAIGYGSYHKRRLPTSDEQGY